MACPFPKKMFPFSKAFRMFAGKTIFFECLFCAFLFAESPVDDFGFRKIYPTREGTVSWNSSHWANGFARSVEWDGDPYDPLGWTESHSSGTGYFDIDGEGSMQMNWNDGPRFHLNGLNGSTPQFFLNAELTAYFMRDASGGKDYGGMVVGMRSGPLGHGSNGGDDCDATTYYARFRNDGKWDFEKEWKHPDSYYRTDSAVGLQEPLWGGSPLPIGKWIGMKYIVYNKDSATVRLELYIDSTSNATPPGNWEPVGVVEDAGADFRGASGPTISGCSHSDAYAPILRGGGTVLFRSDGDHPFYKFVTLREIDVGAPPFGESSAVRRLPVRGFGKIVPAGKFDLLGRSANGK